MHILVAEDNKINAQILKHVLQGFDMEVTVAEDGGQCVDKLTQETPGTFQLILMDIQMPEVDGLEATRRIRLLEQEELKNIPIYAMTADIIPETIAEFEAAGMNGYLAKPVDVSEVMAVIEKIKA